MFRETAHYYDKIYSFKDYPAEVEKLRALIAAHKRSRGKRLLDVACGTGKHLAELRHHFEVVGVDLDTGMLAVARDRLPSVRFVEADMTNFDLGERFDVITCLFSSIGYLPSVDALRSACRSFAAHLVRGGVAVIEPWLTPESYKEGAPHMLTIDEPGLKICRVNTSQRQGRMSILDFHYLIGTGEETKHLRETHRAYLFTREEMTSALLDAGLQVTYDEEGLPLRIPNATRRGLYIASKG